MLARCPDHPKWCPISDHGSFLLAITQFTVHHVTVNKSTLTTLPWTGYIYLDMAWDVGCPFCQKTTYMYSPSWSPVPHSPSWNKPNIKLRRTLIPPYTVPPPWLYIPISGLSCELSHLCQRTMFAINPPPANNTPFTPLPLPPYSIYSPGIHT